MWDRLHGYTEPTPLNDIDLIYFDADSIDEAVDQDYEVHLKSISSYPWSVKNQARMHVRNGDAPYLSVMDAMSYWVEVETAVGARMSGDGEIQLVAPFGCQSLFDKTITLNKKRPKLQDFEARISSKNWLKVWPGLSVRV